MCPRPMIHTEVLNRSARGVRDRYRYIFYLLVRIFAFAIDARQRTER